MWHVAPCLNGPDSLIIGLRIKCKERSGFGHFSASGGYGLFVQSVVRKGNCETILVDHVLMIENVLFY